MSRSVLRCLISEVDLREALSIDERGRVHSDDGSISTLFRVEVDKQPGAEQVLLQAGIISSSRYCEGDAWQETSKARKQSGCSMAITENIQHKYNNTVRDGTKNQMRFESFMPLWRKFTRYKAAG